VRYAGRRALRGLLAQELEFHLSSNTGAITRVVERGLRGIQAVLSVCMYVMLSVCMYVMLSVRMYVML